MTDEHDLVRWSEALAGIARTGLAFTESLYERERYEEVLHVASDIHAKISDSSNSEEKVTEWMTQASRAFQPGQSNRKMTSGGTCRPISTNT